MRAEGHHLETMDVLSQYLFDLFKSKLAVSENEKPLSLQPPLQLSTALLADAEHLSTILAKAYRRPIRLSWSAAEYVKNMPPRPPGFNGPVEDRLSSMFPPCCLAPYPIVDEPCVVVDTEGVIIVWYLPGALMSERQTAIWNSTECIQPHFTGGCNASSWRSFKKFFRDSDECVMSGPGIVNFSPAWFEQGHETEADEMHMSANLKNGAEGNGGRKWLIEIAESSALISSAMRVMHPKLYQLGRSSMEKLTERQDLHEVVKIWSSIFNGVQVISNRECPIHRDNSSRHEWYDLLATVGPYKSTVMEMPDIGIRLNYPSGTLVALCGRVVRHGVAAADGERICVAYYMRENVQRRLGVVEANWSRWDDHREPKL